jgi:hypothetical protein
MSTSKQADSSRDLRELTRDVVELDGDILLLCWDNLLEESWEMLWNWSTLGTSEEWIWDRARGLKVLWEEVVSLFWKKTNFLKRQPSFWKELCIKTQIHIQIRTSTTSVHEYRDHTELVGGLLVTILHTVRGVGDVWIRMLDHSDRHENVSVWWTWWEGDPVDVWDGLKHERIL